MADQHHSDAPHHTTVPVIDPGMTFGSVTDKSQLNRAEAEDSARVVHRLWYLFHSFPTDAPDDYEPDHFRRRALGHQHPSGLGFGNPQFRLVDRNRSRGNIDLCHPASIKTKVAHID